MALCRTNGVSCERYQFISVASGGMVVLAGHGRSGLPLGGRPCTVRRGVRPVGEGNATQIRQVSAAGTAGRIEARFQRQVRQHLRAARHVAQPGDTVQQQPAQ